ncbi:enoyl-CoA hydratase/isomerase family protein [Ochrobactrum chromiisoli]|uniref:Enoyl-CoA hydratase/isomerase family protein n=1 Tax=Ochrobactrum chromiisoli TaxID=2993941 RepID=A0ABT3QV41_9HYPH|nr:enoyl-CoA hydratase/isomerase family protein [Ochrobactrum chromiisoli]MCX2699407.1 enoyl-CoA hydratase/isomerase family protein [Ochrobactrum chromiisoli]
MAIVDIRREGPLAIVTYDRGAKANALNDEAINALIAAADELSADVGIQVVILSGTQSRFSGGVDLKDDLLWRPDADAVTRHNAMAQGGRMCERWRSLPQVTIAAVEGPAVGGGGILALSADFRIMAESAFFQFPEVRLGMTLGWGGLPLLSGLIGPSKTKRLLFTGERVSGESALTLGLCDEIAADGAALSAAKTLAATILECPPLALRMSKQAIDSRYRTNWANGYEADQFLLAKIIGETVSEAS